MHVSLTPVSPLYHCSCEIFSLDRLAESNSCLHVRLMKAIMSVLAPGIETSSSDAVFVNRAVVDFGMQQASVPIIKLNSKLNNEKFSVVAESVSFVSIYDVSGTSRKVIHCHDSSCALQQGSKRAIHNLQSSTQLCSHLRLFKDHYDEFVSGNADDIEYDDVLPMDGSELPQEKVFCNFCTNYYLRSNSYMFSRKMRE